MKRMTDGDTSKGAPTRRCIAHLAGERRSHEPEVFVQGRAFIQHLVDLGPVSGGRAWTRDGLYHEGEG